MRACSPPCTVDRKPIRGLRDVVRGHRPARSRFSTLIARRLRRAAKLRRHDGHEPGRRLGICGRQLEVGGHAGPAGPAHRDDHRRRLRRGRAPGSRRRAHRRTASPRARRRARARRPPRRPSGRAGSAARARRPTRWAPTARSAASPAATGPVTAGAAGTGSAPLCAPSVAVAPNRPFPAAITKRDATGRERRQDARVRAVRRPPQRRPGAAAAGDDGRRPGVPRESQVDHVAAGVAGPEREAPRLSERQTDGPPGMHLLRGGRGEARRVGRRQVGQERHDGQQRHEQADLDRPAAADRREGGQIAPVAVSQRDEAGQKRGLDEQGAAVAGLPQLARATRPPTARVPARSRRAPRRCRAAIRENRAVTAVRTRAAVGVGQAAGGVRRHQRRAGRGRRSRPPRRPCAARPR